MPVWQVGGSGKGSRPSAMVGSRWRKNEFAQVGIALLLFSGFNRNLILVHEAPGMAKRPRLFFAGHGDGTLRTNEGADTAAFAKVVVDLNVAGLLISGDAKIRAEIAAQVAAAAEIVSKAPTRLHDRCLLIETGFDVVKFFGVLLFVPAPDFQLTGFSHPDFLRLTFLLLPNTGPRPGRLSCRWPWLPPPCLVR